MTRIRLITMGLALIGLATLWMWKEHRQSLVAGCLDGGGYWDGRNSRCLEQPRDILLQRALRRS